MIMADEGKTIINVTVQAGAEYVQEKHVQYEIGKVEAGGIGVQVIGKDEGLGNKDEGLGMRVEGKSRKLNSSPITPKTPIKMVSEVFTYRWLKQHPDRILSFYQYLVKLRAIDSGTDHEAFIKLFSGEPTDIIVKWLAPKSALKFLMSTLKERKLITPGGKIWVITESHFKDANDQLFTNLRNEHNPDYLKNTISIIADTLDPTCTVQHIDMLDDDVAQELWSGIKDKGFDI